MYARKCAEVLGVTLEEIDNWQCCGGVFTTSTDEIATKLSSVRALAQAKEKGQPLVSVCSACHNVIKQTNAAMQNNQEFASKVNNYIAPDAYNGETQVLHYLELLRDVVGFDKIKEKVVNPLTGRKIAAYYGFNSREGARYCAIQAVQSAMDKVKLNVAEDYQRLNSALQK